MSYKHWNIKKKNILAIIILITVILLTTPSLISAIIASFSGFLLPKADVFAGRVVWNDVNYYPVYLNRQFVWVKDKVIGKAKLGTSTFIFSLQGDDSWKDLFLGVSYGDNPDEVWVREKCQIPQDGEITSVILVFQTNGEEKMIYDNNLIKKIELWKQSEKKDNRFVLDEDYRCISVYLCYDKCPIGLFEYDLLKFQNKFYICKGRVSWDYGADNWVANDLYIPSDTEVPIIHALFEEFAN